MDDLDLPLSPRKRLKMDEGSMERPTMEIKAMDTSVEISIPTQQPQDSQPSKEAEVGITEFVSPNLPGFNGTLKKRYTDFIVSEILPSGQVVHLDNLKAPKHGNKAEESTQTEKGPAATVGNAPRIPQAPLEPAQVPRDSKPDSALKDATVSSELEAEVSEQASTQPAGPVAQWQAYASKPAAFQLTTEDEALLNSFFETNVVDSILALFNRVLNSPHRKTRDYGTVKSAVITDRELRTKIHQAIRKIFSSRLETSTEDSGAMVISAAAPTSNWGTRASGGRNNSGRQPQQKGKLGWQDLGGEYLHFSLYKENKDTMEVVAFLARQLKVNPKLFQFAGTKDRRGVTVQRVSVYRVHAEKMVPINRTLRNARIGNYEYQRRGLELGELTGNEFVITLRDCQFRGIEGKDMEGQVEEASKTVETATKHLSELGFINYYGLQRFGTFSSRTDTVGVKMLQGNFKVAVEAILDFNPTSLAAAQDPLSSSDMISYDDKARASAIHSFQTTGKAHPALDNLPKKFSAEANIIRHLSGVDRSNDFLGALQTIPRALRLMYVHAYQSLVWNFAASERWRRAGGTVLPGDLVMVEEHKKKDTDVAKPEEVDADGEVIVQPGADDSAANAEDMFDRARALSTEEAESGKYTIFDIVLPTPGYDILYPANEMGDFYKAFMGSEQGGGLSPYDMRRPWKDISLSGSYRKLLARPGKDVSFEIRSYSKDDEQFVETDLERLEKRNHQAQEHANEDTSHKQEDYEVGKSKIAVILKLQLGSSQYATMALRELMKPGGVHTYKPDFGGGR